MSEMADHLDVVEQGQGEGFDEQALPGRAAAAAAQPPHDGRPEIGVNDSNRTPNPSNKRALDFDQSADDLWSLYGKKAKSYDEEWTRVLKEDMDATLIFAGLLSAVLTAFLVPKIQDLKVNPADQSVYYQNQTVHMLDRISQQLASVERQIPFNYTPPLPYPTFFPLASDLRVNLLWLVSLACSLSAALLATVVQRSLRTYMRFQKSNNPLKAARIRQFLFEGTKSLPAAADSIPGLFQLSLLLFIWGLGDLIFQIDKAIFVPTVVPIFVCIFFYFYCAVESIRNPQWPYSLPFSDFIWHCIQICIRINPVQDLQVASMAGYREWCAMKQTLACKDRDVRAVQWLVNNISGNNEMQDLVLAIPGSFDQEWGRDVWKKVVSNDLLTSSVGQPGLLSPTVYRLCRCVQKFFESGSETDIMDSKVQRSRRRRCIEAAASLVCCADVKLNSFGEVAEVLSKVGEKEQTNSSLSIGSNPWFTVRWTCLSLVAIKQIFNDNRLQELAKLALDGFAPFQTYLGGQDAVAMVLTAVQKLDDDMKKAWEAVLDLRLALEPWSQNQNKTEPEIRSILNTSEASIQVLERIAMEAVDLNEIDWRIRLLQETMDEVTHKLTRRLPGVFFDTLHPTAPSMTTEASDQPSVQTARIPPQFIFPGQQLQSIYILGQRLRDITKRQNTEWGEETLKSLKYLREVPIPLCGLNYLMERQLWRLLDLRDGGGLGFTIELFFLALRQLSSAAPSPELEEVFYTGTFDVIKSNWKESKNSAGTQRILLDLLCDLIIQGRGVFSDFRYPRYIVEMLLDLVGKMIEGHGGLNPYINQVIMELKDDNLRDRMDDNLWGKALITICPPSDTAPS